MVGKLKNSNDILVTQRISAQVFTVAGSQTIVVLHYHHCRSNSPGTQKMISQWFILYIGATTVFQQSKFLKNLYIYPQWTNTMNRNLKVNESFLSRFIAIVTLLSFHVLSVEPILPKSKVIFQNSKVIFTVKAIEQESNKEANTQIQFKILKRSKSKYPDIEVGPCNRLPCQQALLYYLCCSAGCCRQGRSLRHRLVSYLCPCRKKMLLDEPITHNFSKSDMKNHIRCTIPCVS